MDFLSTIREIKTRTRGFSVPGFTPDPIGTLLRRGYLQQPVGHHGRPLLRPL